MKLNEHTKREVEEQFKRIMDSPEYTAKQEIAMDNGSNPYLTCMELSFNKIYSVIEPYHGPLMEKYKNKEALCKHVVEDLEDYSEQVEIIKQGIAHLKNIQKRRPLNDDEQEALDFYEGHIEYAERLLNDIKKLLGFQADGKRK